MQTTAGSYYYTEDALGSVISLSSPTNTLTYAWTYDQWGNRTSTAPTGDAARNPFTYIAGYTDPDTLIKFGARFYNPTTGRFTQPDPSHQEPNLYADAKDNPINNSDTTGLSFWNDVKDAFDQASIAGGLAGFAYGLATAIVVANPVGPD